MTWRKILFTLLFLLLSFTAYIKGNNIIGFVASVIPCVLPFSKKTFATTTFDYFVTIYTVIISISAVMYVFAFVGIVPDMGTIEPLNEFKDYNYNLYPLLVVGNESTSSFSRFSGPFDEPGVVGTFNAIILTIYKFNLKDKRVLATFITGFLSLSFFYFVIVGIYYLTYTLFIVKNKKTNISIILLAIVIVLYTYNNDLLYETLWSRFEWDSDAGTVAGDNRMGEAGILYFMSIIGTKEFYFGSSVSDYEYFAELVNGSASFISVIVRYGVVFSSLFVFLFSAYAWKYRNGLISFLLFLFVFVGTIYQRPFIFDPSYMFLFSMMAIACGSGNQLKSVEKSEVKSKKQYGKV